MTTADNWGVQPQGYVRPSYDEILEVINADLRRTLGQNIDLSSSSPLGQIAQVLTRIFLQGYSDGEAAYDAAYIRSAVGVTLDKLAEIQQLSRNPATYATGSVIFSRSTVAPQTYPIPAGTIVATADRSTTYATTAAGSIDAGATASATIPIIATDPGLAGNLAAGTINAITTPVLGVDAVTNPQALAGGSDKETDAVFRSRIKTHKPAARATIDALESALRGIDGVIGLNVDEDTANSVVRVYIIGGDDTEIQTAIDTTRAAGMAVTWARPATAPINVSATVTAGADAVKSAITAYLQSLDVGISVAYSTLVAVAMDGAPEDATISALAATWGGQTADNLGETISIPASSQATAGTITVKEA